MPSQLKPEEYFKDLSAELRAVQNRLRQLIGDKHWPTEGGWKESVLRSIIRGYLPPSMSVGSGFVLTAEGLSKQIDILIYDDSAPVHFRDGETVVIPPDAVRAVIEVKTSLPKSNMKDAIEKLAHVSGLLSSHQRNWQRPRDLSEIMRPIYERQQPFLGLFAYNATNCDRKFVLGLLRQACGDFHAFPITALCFGRAKFYRYWDFDPEELRRPYQAWHCYELPDLAAGYFVHNVIESLYPKIVERSQRLWYPERGKEHRCKAYISRLDDRGAIEL